jgi:hypothetical protein
MTVHCFDLAQAFQIKSDWAENTLLQQNKECQRYKQDRRSKWREQIRWWWGPHWTRPTPLDWTGFTAYIFYLVVLLNNASSMMWISWKQSILVRKIIDTWTWLFGNYLQGVNIVSYFTLTKSWSSFDQFKAEVCSCPSEVRALPGKCLGLYRMSKSILLSHICMTVHCFDLAQAFQIKSDWAENTLLQQNKEWPKNIKSVCVACPLSTMH